MGALTYKQTTEGSGIPADLHHIVPYPSYPGVSDPIVKSVKMLYLTYATRFVFLIKMSHENNQSQ